MRHGKHRFSLGCTKEHREALMANLAAALFTHGKINTTLAKAKALRPFAEKIITLAVKAQKSSDAAVKLHYRRLAIARVRDEAAVKELFDVKASEFVNRNGGYSRIYKLVPRIGDAAKMAIIELVYADDKGYSKSRKNRGGKKSAKSSMSKAAKIEPEQASASTEAGVDKISSGNPSTASKAKSNKTTKSRSVKSEATTTSEPADQPASPENRV